MLRKRGLAVVLADYRVFCRHGTTPHQSVADARAVLDLVLARGPEWGIDPTRLIAGGGSAGGHLALLTIMGREMKPQSRQAIRALVLFNPVTAFDTPQLAERLRVFGPMAPAPAPMDLITKGLPPVLLMHGRQDQLVPFAQAEKFCARYQAAGNKCTLVAYDGAEHGFFNPPVAGGSFFRQTLAETERFLDALGLLAPAGGQLPAQAK